MENNTENIERACNISANCLDSFRKFINFPLVYTETAESGEKFRNYTDLGQNLYDVVYLEVKKELDKNEK